MDSICNTIPQLIQDIEQLEALKTEKENKVQALESQNQKLRYRLQFLKRVNIICNYYKMIIVLQSKYIFSLKMIAFILVSVFTSLAMIIMNCVWSIVSILLQIFCVRSQPFGTT